MARDDDIFSSALEQEAIHKKAGWEEGVKYGMEQGHREGLELGVYKGFEIGRELGFYAGCLQVWKHLQQLDPNFLPSRADKSIIAMEQLIQAFPLGNPKDEKIQELMEALRGKFKAVVAMLNVTEQYLPRAAGTDSLSF